MEAVLFQKIEHIRTGRELDLAFLTEATLVETMDLSGPRLMVSFRDPHRYISDELGLIELDVLRVTLADVYATEGMSSVMDFTVLSCPLVESSLMIEAMHSAVYALKEPSVTSRMFVRRGVAYILSAFFPGMKQDIGRFPVVEDYHLLPGDRPTALLRQIAQEQGASVWVQRDRVCFRSVGELYKQEPDFTYENNNPKATYGIIQFVQPSVKTLIDDRVVRNVAGWSETKGWMKSVMHKAAPVASHSVQSLATINNATEGFIPAMDFTCAGNGQLKAGDTLSMLWHTHITERPLDESMPEKIVVDTVSHHYTAQKYVCRVKGVQRRERK